MPTSTQKRPRQDADSPGSLSESASLKRHRKNASTPSLQSSDRVTSPINSGSGTGTSTSSSSPGSSSDENSHDRPRASNLVYRRRTRVRERREEAEEDDNTSSDESSSPESASSDVDSDSDTDEDEKSSSERETPLPRLPALQKPQIHRVNREPDLLARVSSFLPRMKAANDSLQRSIAEGRSADLRVDHVGEGHEGSYIEMNLGLGVLEERRSDDASSSSDESNSDSSGEQDRPSRESNVLGRLMGKESTSKPTIEEVTQ